MFPKPRGSLPRAASFALILAVALLAGCATAGSPASRRSAPPRPAAEAAPPPVSARPAATVRPEPAALTISAEASVRAGEILRLAERIEPALTSLLTAGAERQRMRLWGLEHRLKTRASLERKIQTGMLEEGVGADAVVIDDAVRYTALIEDEPPGYYNEMVRFLLASAEEAGFEVLEVKNYWPAGDTYSGINCVLGTRVGLRWELQFHTIGSLAAKSEGHDLYEEFRLPTTPVERQRQIFDWLVERWNWVDIPAGVLEERSVHAVEAILLRSKP